MRLFHGRWSRRASLLAAGALDEPERSATTEHLRTCDGCRSQVEDTRRALEVMAGDRVAEAPPVPIGALVARVQARLDQRPRAVSRPGWALPALAAAAAVLLLVWLKTPGPAAVAPPATTAAAFDPTMLRRLERNVAREQAVRYLNEAQDVLVTVAGAPQRCARASRRLDVAEETRRSRELLARRALMVELQEAGVASAGPVLDDVENMLREVAALESCARTEELQAIAREMERRRLLMKIELMTRELAD